MFVALANQPQTLTALSKNPHHKDSPRVRDGYQALVCYEPLKLSLDHREVLIRISVLRKLRSRSKSDKISLSLNEDESQKQTSELAVHQNDFHSLFEIL